MGCEGIDGGLHEQNNIKNEEKWTTKKELREIWTTTKIKIRENYQKIKNRENNEVLKCKK